MNKDDYKQSIKNEVRSVEVAGKNHFYRVPGYLDLDLFSIMKDEGIEQKHKMIKVLASVICDEDGSRVFNPDDASDLKIVRELPNDIQLGLMNGVMGAFFPKESKAQA